MIDAYRRPTARHRPSGPHAHAALAGSSPIDVPRLHLPLKKWSLRKLRGGSVSGLERALTRRAEIISEAEARGKGPGTCRGPLFPFLLC